ncbi:tyrosine-type recombinase/integrase [Arthrobacter sp. CP30]
MVGPPKSGKPRTIPLTTMGTSVLAKRQGAAGGDELVSTTSRGMRVRANNFKRRHFDATVARQRRATWCMSSCRPVVHNLRHTAASRAVQSGAFVKSVQRMLGHATAAMTLDVHAGLFDQDLDDIAVRLDALLAA